MLGHLVGLWVRYLHLVGYVLLYCDGVGLGHVDGVRLSYGHLDVYGHLLFDGDGVRYGYLLGDGDRLHFLLFRMYGCESSLETHRLHSSLLLFLLLFPGPESDHHYQHKQPAPLHDS
jgi:hypothetical protein